MTRLAPNEPCRACQGVLVPPTIVPSSITVPPLTDSVCLRCGQPYRWFGNPPRLVNALVTPVEDTDD
jgi:hypothetical protein